MDRTAVVWTRAFGKPSKIADIVHTGDELRLTYDEGAPCGVSVAHDPKSFGRRAIKYPVNAAFPLPPFLSSLMPQRGGAAWLIGIEYLNRIGEAPDVGDELWPLLLLMGRDAIGHLDVFRHDGLAERWYAAPREQKNLGGHADRRGIWESIRDLGNGMIQSQRMDALAEELGPSPPGVTGMIPKLIAPVDGAWLGLNDAVAIRALIKTEPNIYKDVLALEKRCYEMHETAGCVIPRAWLKTTVSGSPLLITERFDRTADGTPIPCETMFSILHAASAGNIRERWSIPKEPHDIANGEIIPRLEAVANALERTSVGLGQKQQKELFRRLCMALMTGNSDLHLENLSVLGERHHAVFSPVYDPAPMRAWPKHAMTLALSYRDLSLTGGGRLTNLWDRTLKFGTESLRLRRDQARDILLDCRDATKDWIDELKGLGVAGLSQTLSGERHFVDDVIARCPKSQASGRTGKKRAGNDPQ
jgi:serine/threonine-protein kinase HipA